METLYKLRSLGYVEIGNDIWFPNLYFNALIKINKLTGRIELIEKFPNYEVGETWLYAAACLVNEYLVFTPFRSEEIVSYNIRTKEFVSVPLNLSRIGKQERYFAGTYVYGNYVYMFPVEANCMIRFDAGHNVIQYLDVGLSNALRDFHRKEECFIYQYAVAEDRIYIPFANMNAIAVFDPQKEGLDIRYMDIMGGCSGISCYEGYFYMASWKSCKIYRWDSKSGEVKQYDNFPEDFIAGEYKFVSACAMGKRIFFFPLQGNMIVSFDTETGELYKEQRISNLYHEVWDTFFSKRAGGKIVCEIAGEKDICVLDNTKGKLRIEPFFRQNDLYNEKVIDDFLFVNNQYFNGILEYENIFGKYIETVVNSSRQWKGKETGIYGEKIWNKISK